MRRCARPAPLLHLAEADGQMVVIFINRNLLSNFNERGAD